MFWTGSYVMDSFPIFTFKNLFCYQLYSFLFLPFSLSPLSFLLSLLFLLPSFLPLIDFYYCVKCYIEYI